MTRTEPRSAGRQDRQAIACILTFMLVTGAFLTVPVASAQPNLLQNAGFEEPADTAGGPPHWNTGDGSSGKPQVTETGYHSGRHAVALPPHSALEQTVGSAKAGAYIARAWVKSEVDQTIALLVQDTNQAWVGYACAEIKVPKDQWVQIETLCALDREGNLTLTLGELSKDFRLYHGVSAQTRYPILVDDLELVRNVPRTAPVEASANSAAGALRISSARLVGMVRTNDGSLEISSVVGGQLKPRCTVVPSTPITAAKCSVVAENNRKGLRVNSENGDRSYTAWFTPEGLVSIVADHVPQFQVKDCRLRYGLLPSFVGTDILYAPAKMEGKQFDLPSTQWLVGLVDGNDSMLVTVWESDTQAVSLGLAGEGDNRLIDSITIATAKAGFHLSLVDHTNIWHREALKEDWLGDYTPIEWERSFPARWMCQFFVTPATKPTFRQPNMAYAFPIANARTRQWGLWFEDWNNYPFYFDGPRTIFHFDKTFVPNGDALIYFLEPAAADLYSPCEIVEQALGRERALALFDLDANRLRKLSYSTPDDFMYDRPVCATTTSLTRIRQDEKFTVGLNYATHLYEFIREIRRRLDQYGAFFVQVQDYLASEKTAHPELKEYLEEMESMVADAQSRSINIYATPLAAVQTKTDEIKKVLLEKDGDGFSFGNLDCRSTAGSQDDLCRHYNRFVMRLVQTAALNCGDSPQKAIVAKHLWDESRIMLRQPTRWESRRTLYFFEP